MLNLNDLITEDKQSLALVKPIVGKWFEIRLFPDLISGEILNIGVGFIDSKSYLHFRMLDNATPFACLYGKQSQESFQFLLNAVKNALSQDGIKSALGPQIELGKPRYIEGHSVEAILNKLYTSVVSLSRKSFIEDIQILKTSQRNTQDLRKTLGTRFKKRYEKNYRDFWKEDLTVVKVGNQIHHIDMPIWAENTLLAPTCFGTIISVAYSDPIYRKSYLNTAYRDLTIARDYLSKNANGGLFILRPDSKDTKFTNLMNDIENEIDSTTWALMNKYKINAQVTENTDELEAAALNFVQ